MGAADRRRKMLGAFGSRGARQSFSIRRGTREHRAGENSQRLAGCPRDQNETEAAGPTKTSIHRFSGRLRIGERWVGRNFQGTRSDEREDFSYLRSQLDLAVSGKGVLYSPYSVHPVPPTR